MSSEVDNVRGCGTVTETNNHSEEFAYGFGLLINSRMRSCHFSTDRFSSSESCLSLLQIPTKNEDENAVLDSVS